LLVWTAVAFVVQLVLWWVWFRSVTTTTRWSLAPSLLCLGLR